MTKEELDRIKKAYSSGLKVQIWFNGYWKDFDVRDYSMYSDPFSENRQYRIIGSDYADIAEKRIAELEEVRSRQAELINKDTIRMENQKYQIKKLEQENAELEKKLTEKVTLESLDVVSGKIADLEKENAELKERVENQKSFLERIRAKFELGEIDRKEIEGYLENDQLTKAKDHIKKLLDCLKQDTNDPQTNYYVCQYMDKAEQFLKDSEVEK